ncbi:hypothetical protein [Streptomyces sp. NPDC060205]|uniref:hypothetical protein n=1 Tax=Streptomyces sp. NPDC060205 TaxID=3347072 RepID=UPI00366926CE
MQIAGVDLYVNHPLMALGSTEWIPTTLALDGAPAAACDTHLIVRVQVQVALVKGELSVRYRLRGSVRESVTLP